MVKLFFPFQQSYNFLERDAQTTHERVTGMMQRNEKGAVSFEFNRTRRVGEDTYNQVLLSLSLLLFLSAKL